MCQVILHTWQVYSSGNDDDDDDDDAKKMMELSKSCVHSTFTTCCVFVCDNDILHASRHDNTMMIIS